MQFYSSRIPIGLSLIAPRLCELAATRKADALRQAEYVRNITDMLREMTSTLQQTMQQLHLSSSEIGDLTSLIQRIADETRIIAINARIVAAHEGERGKAFSVLAKEIRTLSENTSEATKDVQSKVERLEESTLRTVQTIGIDQNQALMHKSQHGSGLTWLLNSMDEVDAVAAVQANEAFELNELGGDLRALSESMIHSIGLFRLNIHQHIEQIVEQLRLDRELTSSDPRWQITALRQVVKSHPYIELAYVTDAAGIQTTDNVSSHLLNTAYGSSGKHENWSKRPWFVDAKSTDDVMLSNIYRSQATDEFCLTASATYNDWHGNLAGVVAIDVNFKEILGV